MLDFFARGACSAIEEPLLSKRSLSPRSLAGVASRAFIVVAERFYLQPIELRPLRQMINRNAGEKLWFAKLPN